MMKVKVLYFADMEKDVGMHSEVIMFEGCTLKGLIYHLIEMHPVLTKWKDKIAIAVNMEYSDITRSLKDGDTVAFIPPVQGG
jgi:molybdopterin converting factor subunit 1